MGNFKVYTTFNKTSTLGQILLEMPILRPGN